MANEQIHTAMISIMREVGAIAKDKQNVQQGFKYRGIDQVYEAVHPLMCRHGIFMSSEILEKSRDERTTAKGGLLLYTQLRMRYWFHAEDGSKISTEVEGEGMDSGDKSSNKAMAVAHKYAILQAFCIPTEMTDDPDRENHEVAPRPAPAPAPKKATPPKAVSTGSSYTVLAAEKRTDKKGKEFVAVKTQQVLSSGKNMAFCYHTRLFDALHAAVGEDCDLVFAPGNPSFPMIDEITRIGDIPFKDGAPELAVPKNDMGGLGVTDDDIPF